MPHGMLVFVLQWQRLLLLTDADCRPHQIGCFIQPFADPAIGGAIVALPGKRY